MNTNSLISTPFDHVLVSNIDMTRRPPASFLSVLKCQWEEQGFAASPLP